jgi:hypothetical protein
MTHPSCGRVRERGKTTAQQTLTVPNVPTPEAARRVAE